MQHNDLAALQKHVDDRLDTQDEKLDDILAAFKVSRFVVRAIAWLAAVGSAVAVIWANLHNMK